jgi:hypothetical protein
MWEPWPLTPLWAFRACYTDSFTFFLVVRLHVNRLSGTKAMSVSIPRWETEHALLQYHTRFGACFNFFHPKEVHITGCGGTCANTPHTFLRVGAWPPRGDIVIFLKIPDTQFYLGRGLCLMNFNQTCLSPLWENHGYVFWDHWLELECSYSMGTDLWWIES